MQSLSIPIIFLIFRRPDLTALVFEAIREAKPTQLLIIADGPKDVIDEVNLCNQTRALTENINWECKVLRNYSDYNMGSRLRVRTGLDWAFSQVSEAIILEDDCLPHHSFFRYCQELLNYYRYDERIWCVSGNNFQDGQKRGDGSYYFSNYNHCWGWATWRRAWQQYDDRLSNWPTFKASRYLESILDSELEIHYWHEIFERLHNSPDPPNWDYGWTFTCWQNSGLTVLPNINLVSNLGFRSDATNTKSDSKYAELPVGDIGEIKHPRLIARDRVADQYTFEHHFGGFQLRESKYFYNKLMRILSKTKKRIFKLSPIHLI